LLALALTASGTSVVQSAEADDSAPMCSLYEQVSNTQHLRRLSLDLRLTVPTSEEYDALGDAPVSRDTIDQYIASDAFSDFVHRFHADLLWYNVGNVSLSSVGARLANETMFGDTTEGATPGKVSRVALRIVSAQRRSTYRRQGTLTCADFDQAEHGYCTALEIANQDEGCHVYQQNEKLAGMPKLKLIDTGRADTIQIGTLEPGYAYLDGWELVTPYWDPLSCTSDDDCSGFCDGGTCSPVRACAFDAQTNEAWSPADGAMDLSELTDENAPYVANNCNFEASASMAGCGCGPNLNYCWTGDVERVVTGQMRLQMMRLIDDATVGPLGYSEMLTTKGTYYNGPLHHFKKYLAQMTSFSQTFNFHMTGDAPVPEVDVPFTDESWVPQTRTSAVHSGILTLPAFTLRFQTNRGRANRVRTVFMDKAFQPPSGAQQAGCSDDTDDLTQRCYCMHCHVELEPMAAYFGNISEAGSALIDNRALFPPTAPCGVNNRFYAPGEAGDECALLPLAYADATGTDAQQAIQANFDAGPTGLAAAISGDGVTTFHRTVVKHLWRYFMRREMNLSAYSSDNEAEILEELTAQFKTEDDFRAIVLAIVERPEYRRMR